MNIVDVRLWRYALPLRWPLTTDPRTLSFLRKQESTVRVRQPTREGLLLELRTADGRTAWGEIAPLPGLHKETLRQAKLQIQRLLPKLFSARESGGRLGCGDAMNRVATLPEPLFPSVRWGVETALWRLGVYRLDKHSGSPCHPDEQSEEGSPQSLDRWVCHPRAGGGPSRRCHDAQDDRRDAWNDKLYVSALIPPGSPPAMLARVLRRHHQGCRSIKVKVGHLSPTLAARLTGEIHRICDRSLKLRLDAGRRWSLAQALRFGACVRPHWVEYVEEPLRDPRHIPRLHAQTGLWCALDETIHQWPLHAITRLRGVRAWVIKPALLRGGLHRFFQLARAAEEHGIVPVVSSCFESGVGLRTLALLASECPALRSTALGLGTAEWFAAGNFLSAIKSGLFLLPPG